MRKIALLTAVLAAAPAFAHEGLHLHPHGIDSLWLLLSGLFAGLAAGLFGTRILGSIRSRRDRHDER